MIVIIIINNNCLSNSDQSADYSTIETRCHQWNIRTNHNTNGINDKQFRIGQHREREQYYRVGVLNRSICDNDNTFVIGVIIGVESRVLICNELYIRCDICLKLLIALGLNICNVIMVL